MQSTKAFEVRDVDSMEGDRSVAPPSRTSSLECQGPHPGTPNEVRRQASLESALPTAAVDSHRGGALHSKCTRRSRPWNVSTPTAVVASPSIHETWLFTDRSSFEAAEIGESVGSSKGGSCGQGARQGSRILGSPVRRASGRGSSRAGEGSRP